MRGTDAADRFFAMPREQRDRLESLFRACVDAGAEFPQPPTISRDDYALLLFLACRRTAPVPPGR